MLDLQHIAAAPVLEAAAWLEQGRRMAIEGEEDVIGQVVDPGQGNDDALTHCLVADVGAGKCASQVVRQLVVMLEAIKQLDVADQEIVDQVVEHFAEFVAHWFSLL